MSPWLLRKVHDYVGDNLGASLTVDVLAATAGLGPAHFARAFKDATGVTPHRFVIKRSLDESRRAPERKEADVLNVALRFGFTDQAHLTRLFKSEFGITPGRYARTHASR